MSDERKSSEEHGEDEPIYCRQCGDPITGSDQFCAGCGATPAEEHDQPKDE
jgi:hypothetical protein